MGRLVVLQGRALAELTDHLGKLASRGDAAGRRARGAQARRGAEGKGEDLGHLGIFSYEWSQLPEVNGVLNFK